MRGDIYELLKPKDSLGHEQDGRRFAMVVQTTRMEHLSTWLVVPTSSSSHARRGLTRPELDWGNGSGVALCDAVGAIDPARRLGEHVGYATLDQLNQIDRALRFLLDL